MLENGRLKNNRKVSEEGMRIVSGQSGGAVLDSLIVALAALS